MKKDYHIDIEKRREELKKQHPEIPNETIEEGVRSFNEMLDVIQDCNDQITLALENATKVARNINADPVIFSGMLSEKMTIRILKFNTDMHKLAVKAYTDQKVELNILKNLKDKGFFN